MVVEQNRTLISYNDNKDGPDQGYIVANKLEKSLQRKGIDARAEGYSDSALDADTQWLILIHSSEIGSSSPISKTVNIALDRVVERRMRGVLAVTTTTRFDLRPEWASIRKYDGTGLTEEEIANSIKRAMDYAKLPYTQAIARHRGQQKASRRSKKSLLLMVAVVVLTFLVVGSTVLFGVKLHNDDLNASTTATALTQKQATLTAPAKATQVSTTIDPKTQNAMQTALKNLTKSAPTIKGFRPADQWDTQTATANGSCSFGSNNTTYLANSSVGGQYQTCMAANTNFTNFVLQVTVNIVGDAGGVIFRSNSSNQTYYRLSINQSDPTTVDTDTLSLYLCNNTCLDKSVGQGSQLLDNTTLPVKVNRNKPLNIALIAQNNTFDVFINGQFVVHVTDKALASPLRGLLGVHAASVVNNTPTTVTFSNLSVWNLDASPTHQAVPTP